MCQSGRRTFDPSLPAPPLQLLGEFDDLGDPSGAYRVSLAEQATGKGFLFSDLGDVMPKGSEEPVRLYDVRWREEP